MLKGQLLTIDFALSMVIFLTILLTLITLWANFDTQIRDLEDRRDMQTLAVAVSDSLVRSPGNPGNWTSATVKSIGLAEQERILSLDKILKLYGMMNSYSPVDPSFDYTGTRSILRLGNYEVTMYFRDYRGYNLTSAAARSPIAYYARNHSDVTPRHALADKLKGYGDSVLGEEVVWDYYWGGPNDGSAPKCIGADNYSCRYVYADPNATKAFNNMLDNQSSYRTIIVEDMDLKDPSDPQTAAVNNSDLNMTELVNFTNNGGILIVIGGAGATGAGIIDQNFSAVGVYSNSGWGKGNITNPEYFLRGLTPGMTVDFQDAYGNSRDHWVFRSNGTVPINTYISLIGHPEDCMACSWTYGRGYVYYLEEFDPVTATDINGLNPVQLKNYAAVAGNRLNFGNFTNSANIASSVINEKRTVIVDGFYRDPATMEMRVWTP